MKYFKRFENIDIVQDNKNKILNRFRLLAIPEHKEIIWGDFDPMNESLKMSFFRTNKMGLLDDHRLKKFIASLNIEIEPGVRLDGIGTIDKLEKYNYEDLQSIEIFIKQHNNIEIGYYLDSKETEASIYKNSMLRNTIFNSNKDIFFKLTNKYMNLDANRSKIIDMCEDNFSYDILKYLIFSNDFITTSVKHTSWDAINSIEHITIEGVKKIKILKGLNVLTNVNKLTIIDTDLESLEGIESFDLTSLICRNCSLEDISIIKNFTNLETLDCSENQLTDLNGIEKCTKLEYVGCNDNKLTTLKGIQYIKKINYMDCSHNPLPTEIIKYNTNDEYLRIQHYYRNN